MRESVPAKNRCCFSDCSRYQKRTCYIPIPPWPASIRKYEGVSLEVGRILHVVTSMLTSGFDFKVLCTGQFLINETNDDFLRSSRGAPSREIETVMLLKHTGLSLEKSASADTANRGRSIFAPSAYLRIYTPTQLARLANNTAGGVIPLPSASISNVDPPEVATKRYPPSLDT